ncbi:DUF998 domain-containing protein [Streptomyces luteireticuli]|uniref:DUF998 domain-containing protein n=1 Tax=Streptomyces luteireticuli TaxID=173858 RepID=UPI00355782E5
MVTRLPGQPGEGRPSACGGCGSGTHNDLWGGTFRGRHRSRPRPQEGRPLPPEPPSAAPAGRRQAPLLLVTAAVVYNDWLLELVLPTGLDPRHSYVSELYAADQRFRLLFAALELAAAALVVAAALPAARRRGAERGERAGWWCQVAFGVFSVADVIVPMRCAPSAEPGCEAVNPWHTATSALVHAALFASMALLVLGTDRSVRRRGGWGGRGGWVPVVVPVAALVTAVCTVGPLFGHPGWHGVAQRAHLVLVGVWFVVVGVGEWGRRPVRVRVG